MTTETAVTTGFECPACNGAGSVPEMVNWSDGWGMTQRNCSLCDHTGRIDADPVALAIRYKEQAEAAELKHRQFVLHTALYLKTSRGQLPDPPFADAPGPSSYPSTWLPYLCAEIKQLPRLQPGACGHTDLAICRENIEKYPTSAQDAVCRVTLGLPQVSAAR
jgi:hypothetical protein